MTKKHTPVVAITGASGFLGTELTKYFLSIGWRVVGLVRDPSLQKTANNIEWRAYDLVKPLSKNTLTDVDYLVHTAYTKLSTNNPNAFNENISGAQSLIQAAKKSSVKQLIFISTMSAHEDAISVYGKQKLAVEKLFLNTNNATVLRCGLIIGNGGIVKEMASFMKSKHAVPLVGGGRQPLQIISIYDLVKIIHISAEKKLTGRFVAATPKVYEYRQFYKALAKELGVFVAYIPVPYKLLEVAFKGAALLRIPLGVGDDNLKGLKKLIRMDSTKDLETIGLKLSSLKESLQKSQLRK